jgi:hypothetical protein
MLGQQPQQQAPEWAVGIASIVDPLANATSQIYSTHMRAEINAARIKAGLGPMIVETYGVETYEDPTLSRAGFSTTSLLLGLAVLGGVVYVISNASK